VANAALPDRLRRADVLLLPQLYGAGMSKVMIEAMACGLIVVASDIEAHRQVLADGRNGFICGMETDSIAACLRRLLDTAPDELAAIAQQGVEDVSEKYSMRSNARRELAIYRSLIDAKGRAGK